MHVIATLLTHRGRSRITHEDAIVVGAERFCSPMDEAKVIVADLGQPFVCAVADGLGGHNGGRVASGLVAHRLAECGTDLGDERLVSACLASLNAGLYEAMSADSTLHGMGTTVAGIVCGTSGVIYFNVGDSRVFREQDGFLRQLSIDDSRQQAGTSSRVLTQSLGGAAGFVEIEPHLGCEPSEPGRLYLVCSDGLTDMLSLDQMEASLMSDDRATVMRLFESAMAAGGADNISIILVRVVPSEVAAGCPG